MSDDTVKKGLKAIIGRERYKCALTAENHMLTETTLKAHSIYYLTGAVVLGASTLFGVVRKTKTEIVRFGMAFAAACAYNAFSDFNESKKYKKAAEEYQNRVVRYTTFLASIESNSNVENLVEQGLQQHEEKTKAGNVYSWPATFKEARKRVQAKPEFKERTPHFDELEEYRQLHSNNNDYSTYETLRKTITTNTSIGPKLLDHTYDYYYRLLHIIPYFNVFMIALKQNSWLGFVTSIGTLTSGIAFCQWAGNSYISNLLNSQMLLDKEWGKVEHNVLLKLSKQQKVEVKENADQIKSNTDAIISNMKRHINYISWVKSTWTYDSLKTELETIKQQKQ